MQSFSEKSISYQPARIHLLDLDNLASLDELLAVTDALILGRGLGLSGQEIQIIHEAHRRLLKRRLRL